MLVLEKPDEDVAEEEAPEGERPQDFGTLLMLLAARKKICGTDKHVIY